MRVRNIDVAILYPSSYVVLLIYRHCGLKNPSWSEIFHFVKFLDVQLQSCEQSDFCNESLTGPGGALQGFKSFVVTFMLTMSQVRTCIKMVYLCLLVPICTY